MLDNLGLIAAVIVVLWIASLGLYLYTSNQHRELQEDIETLKQSLDEEDSGET